VKLSYLFLLAIFILGFKFFNDTSYCQSESLKNGLVFIGPVINSSRATSNIFFFETNSERDFFSTRVTCAFESAALLNPSSYIQVFSFNAKFHHSYDIVPIYPNVKLNKLKLTEIFEETPLMCWWKTGSVKKSPFMHAHLADALRLAILWKYGGFYSDIDTITLKSFIGLASYDGFGLTYSYGTPDIGNFIF